MLELIALTGLVLAGIYQLQQVDFDLQVREKQEDLRLRDYVISHDLEYVKSELISLQKEEWTGYASRSDRSWLFFLLIAASVVLLVISRLLAFRIQKKTKL
jgi:hypothetical protein